MRLLLFAFPLLAPLYLATWPLHAQVEPEPTLSPDERFGDWLQRDSEGRWALAERDLREQSERMNSWIEAALAARDGDLLVWLATAHQYGNRNVSSQLRVLGDPRWVAVSVWRSGMQNSHAFGVEKLWLQEEPAVVHGWLLLHREALLSADFERLLNEVKHVPADEVAARELAGPLDAEPLLLTLSRACERASEPFGDRLIAIEGELYDHQVRRAIAMLANRAVPVPGLGGALLEVARLKRPEVAVAAGHAFVQVPADRAATIELFDLSSDQSRAPALREALFIGASHGNDAVAWLHLHATLGDPSDARWTAAIERLAEIGDEFTVRAAKDLLARYSGTGLLERQAQRAKEALTTITARLAEQAAQVVSDEERATEQARDEARLAFAEAQQHPLAAGMRRATGD